MKTLFASDHAAWLFIVSSALLIAAIILHRPEAAAMSVLSLYIAFDVLGYKWVLYGGRTVRTPILSAYPKEDILELWDFEQRARIRNLPPDPEVTLAYRIFQHGLFIVILAMLWIIFGYRAALSPFIVWITFGADVAYHWVSKDKLPKWGVNTYYSYGYWSGPVGWWYLLWMTVSGTNKIIPSTGMYVQAIIGACAAVAVWI